MLDWLLRGSGLLIWVVVPALCNLLIASLAIRHLQRLCFCSYMDFLRQRGMWTYSALPFPTEQLRAPIYEKGVTHKDLLWLLLLRILPVISLWLLFRVVLSYVCFDVPDRFCAARERRRAGEVIRVRSVKQVFSDWINARVI